MNKDVKWVKEQLNISTFCNSHERQYLAEQIVERLGKPFGLDNATIRLLNALGELTPDVEINDAVTAMSVATVHIKRLEDGWNKIEDSGLPEEGRWYDAYTWTREGHRTVRELFLDGEVDGAVYWLGDGDWPYPVTHWKERTDPPKEEELL